MTPVTVFFSLGSNLGERCRNIDDAIAMLGRADGVVVVGRSRFYATSPTGPQNQGDFINCALHASVTQSPEALLATAKKIERDLGREPGVRWGPRLIDIDILTYGDTVVDTPTLTIPHRELHRRRFVLEPLSEFGELSIPGMSKTVKQLLDAPEVAMQTAIPLADTVSVA